MNINPRLILGALLLLTGCYTTTPYERYNAREVVRLCDAIHRQHRACDEAEQETQRRIDVLRDRAIHRPLHP